MWLTQDLQNESSAFDATTDVCCFSPFYCGTFAVKLSVENNSGEVIEEWDISHETIIFTKHSQTDLFLQWIKR